MSSSARQRTLVLTIALLCIVQGVALSQGGNVRVLFFHSESCPDCQYIIEYVIPELEKEFGDSLEIRYIDLDVDDNIDKLFALYRKFDLPEQDTPIVFFGTDVIGGEAVADELRNKVLEYAGEGGVDYPEIPDSLEIETPEHPIYIAYFSEQGCSDCDKVERLLKYIQERIPLVEVRTYDIGDNEDKVLNEAMCAIRNVPDDRRTLTPSVVIGDDVLVQDEISMQAMEELFAEYEDVAFEPPWDVPEEQMERARASLRDRFQSFKLGVILLAGLIDGLNPCAFATIIFFISYLTMLGRKSREVLMVGAAFTAAVFCTYYSIGAGLFGFLNALAGTLTVMARIFYGITALVAYVICGYCVYDYIICRRTGLKDTKLQLPKFLKDRIHRTIGKQSRARNFVLGALVAGFLVSLLELACTGQTYLPVITFAVSDPALRSNGLLLLALYNVMFILPLVAVFSLFFFGVSSKQFTAFFQRSAAGVKLVAAGVFFVMGSFLFWQLLNHT